MFKEAEYLKYLQYLFYQKLKQPVLLYTSFSQFSHYLFMTLYSEIQT